jgi:hypothetical protein
MVASQTNLDFVSLSIMPIQVLLMNARRPFGVDRRCVVESAPISHVVERVTKSTSNCDAHHAHTVLVLTVCMCDRETAQRTARDHADYAPLEHAVAAVAQLADSINER